MLYSCSFRFSYRTTGLFDYSVFDLARRLGNGSLSLGGSARCATHATHEAPEAAGHRVLYFLGRQPAEYFRQIADLLMQRIVKPRPARFRYRRRLLLGVFHGQVPGTVF